MDTMQRNNRTALLANGVSRRTALRGIGSAGLVAGLGSISGSRTNARAAQVIAPPIEPDAGAWKTWLLASGDQFRPTAPPDEAATQAELADLLAKAAERDGAALDRISYWDAGSPGYRWNEIATGQTVAAGLGPASYRVMALLNAAIYDATVAAWDAKYAFNRPRPAVADAGLTTAIPTPEQPLLPGRARGHCRGSLRRAGHPVPR